MSKITNFVQNIYLRVKDYHKGTVHSLSNVVFLFPGVCYFIGFLSYLFPYLIISRLTQRGGQKTDCLENIHAMIQLSTWDLQIVEIKQMLKTVMRG
jgi:hypothetical protein